MGRLDAKVAIITGATGGIGEATAQLYLNEGANVMLVGRSAQKLAGSLERVGHSGSVAHFVADAADEAATKDAVAATVEAFGGVLKVRCVLLVDAVSISVVHVGRLTVMLAVSALGPLGSCCA